MRGFLDWLFRRNTNVFRDGRHTASVVQDASGYWNVYWVKGGVSGPFKSRSNAMRYVRKQIHLYGEEE